MARNSLAIPLVAIAVALASTLAGCRQASAPPAGHEASGGDRKILYWVDPMHPSYKSDQPGKAPDCGMDLVPVYAKEEPRATAPPAPGGRKVLYWYDPMKPGTHFDHPGKSPFMDMDLVPKYADQATPPASPTSPTSAAAPGATIELAPEAVSAAGVATAEVRPAPLRRTVRAVGTLLTDETKLVHVAARVAGRLDRLYLDFTGEAVRRGAPIYAIYSPDLVASGREYVLALENLDRARAGGDAGYRESAESLVRASRSRLALWGLGGDQIDRIARTRQTETDLVVRSPIGGTVLEKKVVAGQYVAEGQDLYLLADLSDLWLSVKVYEQDLGSLKVGQEARATFAAYPGRVFRGRIRFVDPVLDPATRTAGVRIELPNPGGLKPGMFANAEIEVDLGSRLAIPRSAVLDTGVRQVVYVRLDPTRFVGREVRLGAQAGDRVEVVSGLKEGEQVVTAANFLLDSQAQLATGQSIQWSGASEVKKPGGSQ
ncbi:MAG TPA: efflux RND transporter periplasmic adaptor subunit [Thermoanaerobaculia bacterium]|nr:efflux RND transporter periplasmic adaptor subunit [Thermoanaerobaculia bacterium]